MFALGFQKRLLHVTNVNTPFFFQEFTAEFGQIARVRARAWTLNQCHNAALFCAGALGTRSFGAQCECSLSLLRSP